MGGSPKGDEGAALPAVGDSRKISRGRFPPMRSSIACLRCRRSKIKCENDGGSSPCDNCVKARKECIFKVPDPSPAPPKRGDPPSATNRERDGGPDRKKLKRFEDLSVSDHEQSMSYAEEVLSASFLTEDVWEQLLDLYKLHFAPELSFLHLPTLKERLARRFRSQQADTAGEFTLLLLGVLTLTARFHPGLVRYLSHPISSSQSGSTPSRASQSETDATAASEYYADVLTMALGPWRVRTVLKTVSVERVQAWLMLGLYEWSQATPETGMLGAWTAAGAAIRVAQYLSLGFGDRPSILPVARPKSPPRGQGGSQQSLAVMDKEVRRRTMFSCFIIDRMLSCGRERIVVIQRDDLHIQLPCSEDRFDLAMEVPTGYLGDERRGVDDSVLSRFIQLVDIWGQISKYSSQGGRLTEECPPWDPSTKFHKLCKQLDDFTADLPHTFTFSRHSRDNYYRHENHQASSVYVLMHMLRCVSEIMLHREYIPFVPIRCSEPEGPLDQPVFPKGVAPPGWWRQSAEKIFKAARDIVELIDICQRKDRLPQSTIVLFAIWTACFVSIVAVHFPQMDTERHVLSYGYQDPTKEPGRGDTFQHGAVSLPFQTMHKMSTWLKMASTYVDIAKRMDKYFHMIKSDFNTYEQSKGPSDRRNLTIREGGPGGGLEEYKQLVPHLKDFGPWRSHEHAQIESLDRARASAFAAERGDSIGPEGSSSRSAMSTPALSFKAINRAGTPILPAPEPQSSPNYRPSNLPVSLSESFADSWRHHSALPTSVALPPPQGYNTAPATAADATNAMPPGNEVGFSPIGVSSEEFFTQLRKQEPLRWGTTGDLGYFSMGHSQETDLPFMGDGMSGSSSSADGAFAYLQQTSGF